MIGRIKRVGQIALAMFVALGFLAAVPGCAGVRRAPVLVAQSGLATANIIGELQTVTRKLTDAKVVTPQVAIVIQENLLRANDQLKPLPDILRTIDRLIAAGDSAAGPIDQAIAILTVVGQDLSVTIAGVPVGETAAPLIALIRQAQQTIQTTLIEIAKLRGGA